MGNSIIVYISAVVNNNTFRNEYTIIFTKTIFNFDLFLGCVFSNVPQYHIILRSYLYTE